MRIAFAYLRRDESARRCSTRAHSGHRPTSSGGFLPHLTALRVLGAVGVSLEDHGPGAAERTGREQIRELRGLARVVRRDAEVHVGCSSTGEA